MTVGYAVLLYDSDEASAVPHLHIVITEPDQQGCMVLVSITTRRAKSDTMICLEPGAHPFVMHASVISYSYSKLLSSSKLNQMLASGDATPQPIASPDLIRRAQAGMNETDRAPMEVQMFFKQQQR